MGVSVIVPIEPTPTMLAAGDAIGMGAAAIWRAMVEARPVVDASAMVARLPSAGTYFRNPDFWGDLEVRAIVIDTHRQITIRQLQALIADRCGVERVPSKSALSRVWKRLDKATVKPGFPQRRR